jgi:DNA mismatch repair ATPase MutL
MCEKIVVIRSGTSLLAVDQHAADERVQLELLQQALAKAVSSRAAADAQGNQGWLEDCQERRWRIQQDPLDQFNLKKVEHVPVSLRQKITAIRQKVCAWLGKFCSIVHRFSCSCDLVFDQVCQ